MVGLGSWSLGFCIYVLTLNRLHWFDIVIEHFTEELLFVALCRLRRVIFEVQTLVVSLVHNVEVRSDWSARLFTLLVKVLGVDRSVNASIF